LARPLEIEPITMALVAIAAVSIYQSAESFLALAADPPEVIHFSHGYTEVCFTPDQLANAIGASSVVLVFVPGSGSAIKQLIVSASQFVFLNAVKWGIIETIETPMSVRFYNYDGGRGILLPGGGCSSKELLLPTITISPSSGPPRTRVTLTGANFGPSLFVGRVEIGGAIFLQRPDIQSQMTDESGDFIAEFYVPNAIEGNQIVEVTIGELSARTFFDVQGQSIGGSGEPAAVQEALGVLGDNFTRAWHFDNATQANRFYDSRPAFIGANTLAELVSGELYWIQLGSDQNVTLNGIPRELVNGWNLITW